MSYLTVTSSSKAENVMQLIGLLCVFILILAACVWTTRFVGNRQFKRIKGGNFQLIESYMIAQNMYLQIIKISGHYFVISVTKESIQMITELTESEVIVARENLTETPMDFKKILSALSKKNDSEKDNI